MCLQDRDKSASNMSTRASTRAPPPMICVGEMLEDWLPCCGRVFSSPDRQGSVCHVYDARAKLPVSCTGSPRKSARFVLDAGTVAKSCHE